MGRYAIVDDTGGVENVIVWDGLALFPPADVREMVDVPDGAPVEPGGRFVRGGKPEWVRADGGG